VRPVPLDVFARPTMMVFPNRSICPHVNDSASPMRIPVSNSTGMRVGRCGVAHCATILGELLKCGIYYQSHQCWEDFKTQVFLNLAIAALVVVPLIRPALADSFITIVEAPDDSVQIAWLVP